MKKKYISINLSNLCILMLLFLFGSLFNLQAEEAALDSELVDFSELKTRLILGCPEFRFVIIDQRTNLSEGLPVIGFSSPFVSFGTPEKKGLLREIGNPLAYSAGSYVFKEKTTIKPDVSFDAGDRYFILISPIPEIISVYSILENMQLINAGSVILVPIGDKSFSELLFSYSDPGKKSEEETWFPDKRIFPGGKLIHTGGKVHIDADPFFISSSIIFSGGNLSAPGFFSHLDLALSTDWIAPALFVGYCSESYLTPDGELPSDMLSIQGKIDLSLLERLLLNANCGLDLKRLSLRPASFIGSEENEGCRLQAVLDSDKDSESKLVIDVFHSVCFESSGKKSEELKLGIGARFDSTVLDLSGAANGCFEDYTRFLLTLDGKMSLTSPIGIFLFSIGASVYPDQQISSSFKYSIRFGNNEIFVSVRTAKKISFDEDSISLLCNKPFDFISATIGFEAKKK